LEIGGPSEVFSANGLLPVYPLFGAVDGVQFSAQTYWHQLDSGSGYVVDDRRRGELHIVDDAGLAFLGDGQYDVVLSSHVIEHLANPLRALSAWRRVSVDGAYVLVIAPHMSGTFDHRRPLTTLEHMVADYEGETSEDDLTHLEEVVLYHDRNRDGEWTRGPEFEMKLCANATHRLLHHHTFTTLSLVELLHCAGLRVLAAETRLPHDIYLLAQWTEWDRRDAEVVRRAAQRSPFAIDRRQARQRHPAID
jgi:SAM-dependent methyltransferase